MWKLQYSRDAQRDISKLERPLIKRILKKLETTRKNPYNYFKRLVGEDEYRLRIGDYRIIAFLLSDKTIYIQRIGHRKNIYK